MKGERGKTTTASSNDPARSGRFPHACRDGHDIIGHRDSEHEMCPLCRVLSALKAVVEMYGPSTDYTHEAARVWRQAEYAIATTAEPGWLMPQETEGA